jgi:hypothetical protein
MAKRILAAAAGLLMLSACTPQGAPEHEAGNETDPEPETVDIPQAATEVAPGTTPMGERVAVIGVLNKRNGISRDLEMRPGEATRIGDLIVRLRACETTAPWEVQRLTGAFVQVDVRKPDGAFERVFSGWLYRESPSLNVVQHPVYDVWPKSCEMTHPEAAGSTVRSGSAASSRSSAPNSAPSPARPSVAPAPAAPAPTPAPTPEAPPTADDSN